MTREELVGKASKKYCQDNIPNLPQMHLTISTAFEAGAEWADEHLSMEVILDVWNLATETAIKQLSKKIPYFGSEKEAIDYIIKQLKL
nr:MAG TPA: hypothetical protein [Caudoviricetes sp.]